MGSLGYFLNLKIYLRFCYAHTHTAYTCFHLCICRGYNIYWRAVFCAVHSVFCFGHFSLSLPTITSSSLFSLCWLLFSAGLLSFGISKHREREQESKKKVWCFLMNKITTGGSIIKLFMRIRQEIENEKKSSDELFFLSRKRKENEIFRHDAFI